MDGAASAGDTNTKPLKPLASQKATTAKDIPSHHPTTSSNTTITTKNRTKRRQSKVLYRADKVLATRTSYSRSQSFDLLQSRRVAIFQPTNNDHASSNHPHDVFDSTSSTHNSSSNSNSNYCNKGTLVNIKGPKEKIPMDAILVLDGKTIPQLPPLLVVHHKPKFVLSAMRDDNKSTKDHLGAHLPERYQKAGMHPVERLDYDTTGLILFSREGDLTQRLLHPRHAVEKEYIATVEGGRVDVETLKHTLEVTGVQTSEGLHYGQLIDVQELSEQEMRDMELNSSTTYHSDEDSSSEPIGDNTSINQQHKDASVRLLTNIRLVVQEGKYRMVRRMLANCGYPVVDLKRERHGQVVLGDLPVGAFRDATEDEIRWAESLLTTTTPSSSRTTKQ